MTRPRGAVAALLVPLLLVPLAAGCAAADRRRAADTATGEARLAGFAARAAEWGEEIVARVPDGERAAVSSPAGGPRPATDGGAEWPRRYVWFRIVELRAGGPRTPTELADDLDPWLASQGWERRREGEFPAAPERFQRDYGREGFRLVVDVATAPPPRAQTVALTIVSPATDALGRAGPEALR